MIPVNCLPIFDKLREAFSLSLDTHWFRMIVESSPLKVHNLRPLREFLTGPIGGNLFPGELDERLAELELLVNKTRAYILPSIKEKLQISPLMPEEMVEDQDERVLRQFVAYTLPHNLTELERLLDLFRQELLLSASGAKNSPDKKAACS